MTSQIKSMKGSGGALFSWLYLAGMVLLFLSERMVLESTTLRVSMGSLALLLLLAAIVGRFLRRRRVPAAARGVEGLILLSYLGGLAAVLLYASQADFMMDRLRPMFEQARGADRYQGALSVLWPVVWLCSVLPLMFMELSYATMDLGRTLEPQRVRRSARSGLLVSLTICIVFVVNFIGAQYDKKTDLSYFKTTRPSESSQKMVKNLSQPVKALLFFPGANEVQEQVQAYFTELDAASKKFTVEVLDHALEPTRAKALSVSENGVVALLRGKVNEQIRIGTELDRAKRTLKKLDSEFQQAFTKLVKARRVAYLTVGHEERTEQERDQQRGSSIRDMRNVLRQMNYDTRELGIAQGLASGVPGDATVVIMIGPRKPLLQAEVSALHKYLRGGGRMIAFLDPEPGQDFADFLGPFGLRLNPTRLANDKAFVRITYTPADRHFVYSNRFSSHPSVSTLTRNSHRLATVLLGAGYLEEIPSTGGDKPQVQFTIHSMPGTWNDANSNRVLDAATEKRKEYELAAVVTQKVKGKAKAKAKAKAKDIEGRLLVVADSDCMSDKVFRNAGNGYLLIDALKWMGGEEDVMGETTSEEDVRLVHTRKKDQLWFYLTIFGVPALVLAGGLVFTRRRRNRS